MALPVLCARAAAGAADAKNAVLAMLKVPVERGVRNRLAPSDPDFGDAMQAASFRLMRRPTLLTLSSMPDDDSAARYAYVIGVNVARDVMARRRRDPLIESTDEMLWNRAGDFDPERMVVISDLLDQCFRSLPANQQRVIEGYLIEGRSYREIAAAMNVSEENARKLLSRAYGAFREFLERNDE